MRRSNAISGQWISTSPALSLEIPHPEPGVREDCCLLACLLAPDSRTHPSKLARMNKPSPLFIHSLTHPAPNIPKKNLTPSTYLPHPPTPFFLSFFLPLSSNEYLSATSLSPSFTEPIAPPSKPNCPGHPNSRPATTATSTWLIPDEWRARDSR